MISSFPTRPLSPNTTTSYTNKTTTHHSSQSDDTSGIGMRSLQHEDNEDMNDFEAHTDAETTNNHEDTGDLEDDDLPPEEDSVDSDLDDQAEDVEMEELDETEVEWLRNDAAGEIAHVQQKASGELVSELVHKFPTSRSGVEHVRRYVHRDGDTWCEVYSQGNQMEENVYKLIHVADSEIDLVRLPKTTDAAGLQYVVNHSHPPSGQWRPYFHGGYHTGCALFHRKTTYRYPALDLLRPTETPAVMSPPDIGSRYHPGRPPDNPQEHAFFTISETSPDSTFKQPHGDIKSIIDVMEWLNRMPGTTEFAFITLSMDGDIIFRIKLQSRFHGPHPNVTHDFEFTQPEWEQLPTQSRAGASSMESAAFAMDFRATEHEEYEEYLVSRGWEAGRLWLDGMEEARQFNYLEWHYNCEELFNLSTARAWHEVSHQVGTYGIALPDLKWKRHTVRMPITDLLAKRVEIVHPSELKPHQTDCLICMTAFAQLEEFPARFNCRCGTIFGLRCISDWYRDMSNGTLRTCPTCRDSVYQSSEVHSDLYPLWQGGDAGAWTRNNQDLDIGLNNDRRICVNEAQLGFAFAYVMITSNGNPHSLHRSPESRYHLFWSMRVNVVCQAWNKNVHDHAGQYIYPQDLLANFKNILRNSSPRLQEHELQYFHRESDQWCFFGDVDAPWSYWMRAAHRAINFCEFRGISVVAEEAGADELEGDFGVRTLNSDDIVKGGQVYRVFFNKDGWGTEVTHDEIWEAWKHWRIEWTKKRRTEHT
ncbi:MAG: hypothetical protein M1822_006824 [Bathelium mastoideum]|nr:MAG: hypothetical protein M1822_006824 [Bathelium mastoideum]